MLKKITAAVAMSLLALSPMAQAQGQKHPHQRVSYTESVAPRLNSNAVLILNGHTGDVLYQKNSNTRTPIASITKLMTAMVMLDAGLPMNEELTITDAEVDRVKHTTSRLAVGTKLPRREMLLLALMSSENRAAHTLARNYPGGVNAFVRKMNQKARALGMTQTIFYDPTGLDMRNTSTAHDLAKMVRAAYQYPLIRQDTTTANQLIHTNLGRTLQYKNSNALVREGDWEIGLSKTGYIQEAGRCLVMQAHVGTQPLIMVFLDASASSARINDAKNIKTWLETQPSHWLAG